MSIFPEVYKKAISIINSPIDMLCEDGSMSVVPTNKAKEAVGVMQEEVARLEQQLAKVNERAEMCENIFSEAPDLTFDEVQRMFSDELNKFALEKKIEVLKSFADYAKGDDWEDANLQEAIKIEIEQLRKEQE